MESPFFSLKFQNYLGIGPTSSQFDYLIRTLKYETSLAKATMTKTFSLITFLIFCFQSYDNLADAFPSETKIGYHTDFRGLKTKLSNELFQPASVSKLFTAYTALKKLGPEFRFQTLVNWKISPDNPSLATHMTFTGNGDPTFGVIDFGEKIPGKRMKVFAAYLKSTGITSVSGPIDFLPSTPDLNRRQQGISPRGWISKDFLKCYGFSAFPAAFNFRENCGFYTVTDLTKGRWDTPSMTSIVHSELKYGSRTRISLTWDPVQKRHKLIGTLKKGKRYGPIVIPYGYTQTIQGLKNEFLIGLREAGIIYSGVRISRENFTPMEAIIESPPLREILKPFLKESLNFVGENLILAIGSKNTTDALPTYERGLKIIQEITAQFSEASPGSEIINDGSGLSRTSQVAPKTVWNLLLTIREDAEMLALFSDYLPISGVDGTLKDRFNTRRMTGSIRAKTGSLDGVSTLAGYIRMPGNTTSSCCPFVILNQNRSVVSPRPGVDALISKWTGLSIDTESLPRPGSVVQKIEGSRFD